MIAMSILVVGIAAGIIAVSEDQTGVAARLADSQDAHITTTYFTRDIQDSRSLAVGESPVCGSSTQHLGLTTGTDTVTSAMSLGTRTIGPSFVLVRDFCSGGGSPNESVLAHDVKQASVAVCEPDGTCMKSVVAPDPTSGIETTNVQLCPSAGSCQNMANANPAPLVSTSVKSVEITVTEQSGYQYTLSASPRMAVQGPDHTPGSTPPLLLLQSTAPAVVCDGSSGAHALSVNGVAAINAAGSTLMSFGGGDTLTAQQVYSGSANPVSPPSALSSTSTEPYTQGPPFPDPYANLADPTTAGLTTYTDSTDLPGPGIYSNRVTITGPSPTPISVPPGTYIFENGITATNEAVISGTNVQFFIGVPNDPAPQTATFTDSDAVLDFGNSGGVVVFQARTDSNTLNLSGDSHLSTGGVIYAPDAAIQSASHTHIQAGAIVAGSLICKDDAEFALGPASPTVPTTTQVTSSIQSSVTGQPVTFSATVSAGSEPLPVGTVTFTASRHGTGAPVDICQDVTLGIDGTASCTTTSLQASGSPYTINAAFDGNLTYEASTPGSVSPPQLVNVADTTTALMSSETPSVPGQQVTYTASVTAVAPGTGTPTGTVAFSDANSSISQCSAAPLKNGQATCSVTYTALGSHSITATYSGDGNYGGSSAGAVAQTVGAPALTIALLNGAPVSFTGTTNYGTSPITVSVYLGNTVTGTPVKTYTDTAPVGSGPSWTWSTTTNSGDLTSGATFTAVATQADAAGDVGSSSPVMFVAP
jgi:hypothetical protein